MARLTIVLFLLLGLVKVSIGCCNEDNRTLTEWLFKGNPGTIFTCKILASSTTKNKDFISTAQIIKVYFGTVDSSVITLNSGNSITTTQGYSLIVGKIYLLFSGGKTFTCCSICDRWTKQVSDIPDSTYEIKLLNEFSDIIKNKRTGNFIFRNTKGIVIAEGRYEKGIAVGEWKHYNDNGTIKVKFDLKINCTSQFFANGFIKNKQTSYKNINIYEYYSEKVNGLIQIKEIDTVKTPDLTINTFYEYYDNGNLKRIHGQYDIHGSGGGINISEEYYLNGNLQLHGQYDKNKKVGLWKWYNEDGTLKTVFDYKGGTTN